MDLRLFLTVFSTVFLAELGDKTQLATLLYAADRPGAKLVVFLGAAAALVTTSALGVAAGGALAAYVDPRLLVRAAGVGFIVLGVWTLALA
jgi:putative Ca2+/H+ antiporter (TMEM165/GDT1 family)